MPFIPPGYGNIRFMMRHDLTGNDAITAIGVSLVSADPPAVLDDVNTAFGVNLSQYINEHWDGEQLQLVVGTSDPDSPLIYNHGPWAGGTATGDPLPPNCAYVVNKRTLLGGRKGRGRMFLPSPNESAFDASGRISSTQKTALDEDLEIFLETLNGIDGIGAAFLLHSSSVPSPTEIESMDVSALVGQQKRRLR